jgi:hypothetical protein
MNPSGAAAAQTCPVCGVTITHNVVRFSSGDPGTRARLYARVCRYVQKPGCINQDPNLIGEVLREDGFLGGEEIQLPFDQ